MRILGFQKLWDKLTKGWEFTTFRLPRADKDWQVNELVQVVLKPRSKKKVKLGTAIIVAIEPREFDKRQSPIAPCVTDKEAILDGFNGKEDMYNWMTKTHGHDDRFIFNPMNKLTLKWVTIKPEYYDIIRRTNNVRNS